ncbi:hypothetical protein QR680_015095 [Steinernema hermaphroditum]|uniref:poly(ADP-ribose) glycohydrolase n=1 Tax=Steinernema hermaphroditum TaxID=289476 RepID=A0AA39M5D9_9BILA|nr:hypothetical protein QR680_015095 [Steinernema hermaphroditum]
MFLFVRCEDDSYGWETKHVVRMPFSTSRLKSDGSSEAEFVKCCLMKLTVPQKSIELVTTVIDSYQDERYQYDSLHTLFNKKMSPEQRAYNLEIVIPNIAKLALRLSDLITKPIPRLRSSVSGSVTFSQEQVACLMANAFLCTFPPPSFPLYRGRAYMNFSLMFKKGKPCKMEKLKCFLHYFDSVTKNMPNGLISVRRNCKREFVDFSTLDIPLCDLHVETDVKIEDTDDKMLEIDFANKNIGGGVLNSGCVQEEIRFTTSPELIISMLVCERMNDNEAISIVGAQRFCDYKGYGDSFQYVERKNSTPVKRDRFNRILSEVVGMDATRFTNDVTKQLEEESIRREITKAYVGFDHLDSLNRPIATGNWGCGIFKGDRQLKSLIQLIAASAQKRRALYYCTFGDEEFTRNLKGIYEILSTKNVSVGTLYNLIIGYKTHHLSDKSGPKIFDYVESSLR